MSAQPKKMIAGMAVGLVGAIIALAAMAYSWNGDVDSIYNVALNMLVAMMFFAVAGGFSKQAPVAGKTLVVLTAVNVAFAVIATIYSATFIQVEFVLVVLAVVEVLCAACPKVIKWIDNTRSA